MSGIKLIALWRPRADEFDLAASLNLCANDPKLVQQLIDEASATIARDHPGVAVRVGRWHVWRVVRTMHRAGLVNDAKGRAAAYAILSGERDED